MPIIMDGTIDSIGGKGSLKKRAASFINSLPKSISLGKLKAVSYGEDKDIDSILEKAYNALLYLADVDAYSKIEFSKQNSTIIPANLGYLEIVNKFYFFISMIGFIDKQIRDNILIMEHHSHFIDYDEYSAEAYHKSKTLIDKLMSDRKKVILELKKTNILKRNDSSLPDSFDKIINKVPMYESFADLYTSTTSCSYCDMDLDVKSNFISAYTNGYNASCNNSNEIVDRFFRLYKMLHKHINEDEEKITQYTKK